MMLNCIFICLFTLKIGFVLLRLILSIKKGEKKKWRVSCTSFGLFSLAIMKCWCEVLFKLAQNFFQCVPDQCARNVAKAAKWVVCLPHPAVLEVLCSVCWEIHSSLSDFQHLTVTGQRERGGCSAPCVMLGSTLWTLATRAAQQGKTEARGWILLHCWHRIPGSGLRFSVAPAWSAHTMELCIPPPPAQGFCFFEGGGGCFSVPADVNKIARWHFNALQRDRSLLLPGSRGSHSFTFPEVV